MNRNKIVNKSEWKPLRRACAAGLTGVALALILMFAAALCMEQLILPQGSALPAGKIILFLSALCAAYLACVNGEGNRAARAGISAAVLLIFVVFAAVLTKNSSVFNMSLLWNFLCVICGAALGLLVTARRPKRRRRRS